MPPCPDVYVWVNPEGRRAGLERFIERYVDLGDPGDARFAVFERVHVLGIGTSDDRDALAELRRDDASGEEFSLYLHARHHESAIITVTREEAVVLGLSLDDPFDSPDVLVEGTLLLRRLCQVSTTREN